MEGLPTPVAADADLWVCEQSPAGCHLYDSSDDDAECLYRGCSRTLAELVGPADDTDPP